MLIFLDVETACASGGILTEIRLPASCIMDSLYPRSRKEKERVSSAGIRRRIAEIMEPECG